MGETEVVEKILPEMSEPNFKGTNFKGTKMNSRSLWQVSAQGTDLHPLFPRSDPTRDQCCGTWTPEGKYFVFQSTSKGKAEVWAMREKTRSLQRASREPVQLTSGPMSFYAPQLSLDGKKLFVAGEERRAELVRYDPKSAQYMPYPSGISAGRASFSRDGQWVAYVTYPEGV